MKPTADEIKKALKSCSDDNCGGCVYYKYKATCQRWLAADALKYIEKLEVISNVTMPGTPKEEDDEQ